ncbi:MAG: hypothetical protein WBD27_13660 [Pyrinomonadaceae bacterium]
MKIQTSIVAGVMILLFSVGLINLAPHVMVQGRGQFVQQEVSIVVKPLKVGDEIVSVDIRCEPLFITKPDTIERFNCVLVNLTGKNIRASSVRYSVISENAGKEQRSDRLDTIDTYIHPDLAEIKKPIAPGEKLHIMASGPLVESGSVIKRLELEPIYIEFSDGTTIDAGGRGAPMITALRDGAARYKQALRKEFQGKGNSVQAILPLLQNKESIELENFSGGESIGANTYRKFLLEKYEKAGVAAMSRLLEN